MSRVTKPNFTVYVNSTIIKISAWLHNVTLKSILRYSRHGMVVQKNNCRGLESKIRPAMSIDVVIVGLQSLVDIPSVF